MGIYADIKAAGVEAPATGAVGLDRVLNAALSAKQAEIDPTVLGDFATANEVQSIAFNANIDGGTFTLTVTLYDGTAYTTAAIAYNASAATIQTALDTASPASVANGAVVVSGGNIATANIVLTFSGTGAAGKNHGLTAIGTNSLTDGGVPVTSPVISVTTTGKPARTAMLALFNMGVVTGTVPVQGVTPTDWTKNPLVKAPRASVISDLAKLAAREEGNDAIYTVIAALYNLPTTL